MKRLLFLLLCSGLEIYGQASSSLEMFALDNGAKVLYQTSTYTSDPPMDSGLTEASGNVIRRMLRDPGEPWLGFEIHVERQKGASEFRISLEPLAGWPFFAQKPEVRSVHDKGRVMFEVFEQPSTGFKIYDSFQIGTSFAGMQALPTTSKIPQVISAGSKIRLVNPQVSVPSPPSSVERRVGDKILSRIDGTVVGIRVPGRGRYTISSNPGPGFRLEGTAEGELLAFVVGAERYDVKCDSPITESRGAWYVWVKFEPETQTSADKSGLELFVR
jgi:hypothetical protein